VNHRPIVMEVILDQEDHPRGVLVSLEEWDTVKQSVDTKSERHRLMEDLTVKMFLTCRQKSFPYI
jgi:hypothetical protein